MNKSSDYFVNNFFINSCSESNSIQEEGGGSESLKNNTSNENNKSMGFLGKDTSIRLNKRKNKNFVLKSELFSSFDGDKRIHSKDTTPKSSFF